MKTGKILVLSAMLLTSATAFVGCSANKKSSNEIKNANADSYSDIGAADSIQEGTILHAWNWSMTNIKNNMAAIAAAGYTTVQTSPMQPQKDYYPSNSVNDGWWKLYQPLGFSVATKNNAIGTKSELADMCNEAKKYGVKVVVDVVANHLAGTNDSSTTANTLNSAVKEYEPAIYGNGGSYYSGALLHESTYEGTSDSDAYKQTHGNIGIPDLDTGNQTVQDRVASLLKEYIDCGVDGFRFDAVKHIETPSDRYGVGSDFWTDVLGQAASYAKSKGKAAPYSYGEILYTPGYDRQYSWYTDLMSVVDNVTGNNCTQNVLKQNASAAIQGSDYNSNGNGEKINPYKAVLWGESHDTYADGSTKNIDQSVIDKSYAISASRNASTSLYLARPSNPSSVKLGEASSTAWKSPSITAVNRFHTYFSGSSEYLSSNGSFAMNTRYNASESGMVIVNVSGGTSCYASVPSVMKNGKYKDQVSGNTFTVSNGVVSGTMASSGIAVLFNPSTTPDVQTPTISLSGATNNKITYKEDSFSTKVTLTNTSSAYYTLNDGKKVALANGDVITLNTLQAGETATLKVVATSQDNVTKTETYTVTRKDPSNTEKTLYFKNTIGWSTVNVYLWNKSTQSKLAAWPGTQMEFVGNDVDGNPIYGITYDTDEYDMIIFNNGSAQTGDITIDESADGYFLDGSQSSGKYNASTCSVKFTNPEQPEQPENPTTEQTIYFKNTAKWATVNAYSWNSSANKSSMEWPGEAMTLVGKDVDGNEVYSIKVSSSDDMIIFNNGSAQTVDTKIQSDAKCYCTGNAQNSKYTVNTCTYTLASDPIDPVTPVDPEDPVTPVNPTNEITVYFTNNYNWSTVKAYVWNDTTKAQLASWPGTEMTYVGTNEYNQKLYSITIDLSTYDHIIFTNGTAQTVNITLTAESSGYYISGGSSTSYTVGTYTK